jgi:hypothetical protein
VVSVRDLGYKAILRVISYSNRLSLHTNCIQILRTPDKTVQSVQGSWIMSIIPKAKRMPIPPCIRTKPILSSPHNGHRRSPPPDTLKLSVQLIYSLSAADTAIRHDSIVHNRLKFRLLALISWLVAAYLGLTITPLKWDTQREDNLPRLMRGGRLASPSRK